MLKYIFVIIACLSLFSCATFRSTSDYFLKTGNNAEISLRQCFRLKNGGFIPQLYSTHPELTPDARQATINAFDYFNKILGRRAFIHVGDLDYRRGDAEAGAFITVSVREINKNGASTNVKYREECITKADVEINSPSLNLTQDEIESIVRHEVGHILGMQHNPDLDSLMYRYVDMSLFGKHPKDLMDKEVKALRDYYKDIIR